MSGIPAPGTKDTKIWCLFSFYIYCKKINKLWRFIKSFNIFDLETIE